MLAGRKARRFPDFFMCRDSTTAGGPAVWPFLAYHAQAGRHVCSCLSRKSSSTSRILGVVARRFSAAGDDLSCRHGGRASEPSRGCRARSEAEAQARRGGARSSGAGASGAGCAGTSGYAGRAARREDDRTQPGPQYHLRADGDGADHDQPQHHRGAATGRERNGRKDRIAVSRRYPGFGGRRQFPCAQRARQCADSHQRHHASRRRQWFWHVPRHRLDRQHLPDHRRTPAAIRPAHLRRPRHPDPQRRLQQYRDRRHLRRQPGNVYPKLRVRRHRWTDAILFHRPLLREQYRPGKSDAELERHPRPHRAGARVRLRLDPARPLYAVHLHYRRLLRALPDSRHPRPAVELHRLRRLQLQFGAAQREPARAELFWHCGGATLDQRR